MSSIRKRDGKYQVRVFRQGHKPIAKTFISRVDAVRWGRRMEVMIEQGLFQSGTDKFTLADLIKRYLREVTPTKKNARSEGYLLTAWKEWECSARTANRIGAADVALWRDKKLGTGVCTGTVRNALAALSSVYRHAALDWGMDRLENPVMRLKRPAPGRARTRRVSETELRAIKTHTESAHLPPMIDLAVETGMRLSELVNLRWEYVSLRERTALLPDTKNGDTRTVPLSSKAAATLEALRSTPVVHLNGRLFSMTPHAVSVAFRRAVKRARAAFLREASAKGMVDDGTLANIRFHDLRHEAVSRLFELGLNVIEVGTISGHKTIQMLKRYTHLKASDLVKRLG